MLVEQLASASTMEQPPPVAVFSIADARADVVLVEQLASASTMEQREPEPHQSIADATADASTTWRAWCWWSSWPAPRRSPRRFWPLNAGIIRRTGRY